MRRPSLVAVACVVTGLAHAACAQAPQTSQSRWGSLAVSAISINNGVSRCVTFEPRRIVADRIVRLVVEATPRQSTGACGCTSALLAYKTGQKRKPEHRETWVSAVVSAAQLKPGSTHTYEFVLTADASIPFDGAVTLEIACAPHE